VIDKRIEVAVGIVFNEDQKILIAQRPSHTSHPGFWEFPGGKIEANEIPEEALIRELNEEVGITPKEYDFLKKVSYDYETKKVLLWVYKITKFTGNAYGAEGQIVQWVDKSELQHYQFPAANKIILEAVI
jgi:8-oxo-dGTP diphosphatase